jgi:hypothetical protein
VKERKKKEERAPGMAHPPKKIERVVRIAIGPKFGVLYLKS